MKIIERKLEQACTFSFTKLHLENCAKAIREKLWACLVGEAKKLLCEAGAKKKLKKQLLGRNSVPV
jgi:hypothetical protein